MDVLTFGETMVLLSTDQQLPLEYAHQFSKQFGGAESNVAIGLARLGHQSGWFSRLGQDPFGTYIRNAIRGEGVDTSRCLFTAKAQTGIYFKEKKSVEHVNVYYYRKDSAASRLSPKDLDEAYLSKTQFLHITGITPALSQSARDTVFEAIRIAKKHHVKICFDPNIRFKLWQEEEARQVLIQIAKQADYVLAGLEEGAFLTGEQTSELILEKMKAYGPATIILKCGKEGSYFKDEDGNQGFVPSFSVKQVVDQVGAGDGFASGFLSGLLRGETLSQAVRRGNAMGALVVQVNGDIEGLPTGIELDLFLEGETDNTDVKR